MTLLRRSAVVLGKIAMTMALLLIGMAVMEAFDLVTIAE
jgi:hypothetical protein